MLVAFARAAAALVDVDAAVRVIGIGVVSARADAAGDAIAELTLRRIGARQLIARGRLHRTRIDLARIARDATLAARLAFAATGQRQRDHRDQREQHPDLGSR